MNPRITSHETRFPAFVRAIGLVVTICGLAATAQSQKVNTIAEGVFSSAGFIADAKGNLYSTTYWGGNYNCGGGYGCGTVFKLSPTDGIMWSQTVLHTFNAGADGASPAGSLVFDTEGNLYGTTAKGGGSTHCPGGCGTVFKLSYTATGWKEQILHVFTGIDGSDPLSALVVNERGDLLGVSTGDTCTTCGATYGTAFKLTLCSGHFYFQVLHAFNTPANGMYPLGPLARDAAGNLYGVTAQGGNTSSNICGPTGCGVIFKLTPTIGPWPEKVLHTFTYADGSAPNGGLAFDATHQNLYGTTATGGSHVYFGNVYKINPATGNFMVTYSFTGNGDVDAGNPNSGVVFDSEGNVYGSNAGGYNNNCDYSGPCGSVFKLSPGAKTILAIYVIPGAVYPGPGGLFLDRTGNIYGVGVDTVSLGFAEAYQILP